MSDPVSVPSPLSPRPGPHGPRVPLSVWAAGPAHEAALAVTAFSRPGDLVVVLDACAGSGAVLEAVAAAGAGRRVLGLAAGVLLDPACPHAGQAALVIAAMARPAGGEVYSACERALRPGGILAVLTAAPPPGPAAGDGGQVVAAARAAGLAYAQHIVALQVPVTGGELAAPPGTAPAAGAACARVHSDVWILAKPAGGTA